MYDTSFGVAARLSDVETELVDFGDWVEGLELEEFRNAAASSDIEMNEFIPITLLAFSTLMLAKCDGNYGRQRRRGAGKVRYQAIFHTLFRKKRGGGGGGEDGCTSVSSAKSKYMMEFRHQSNVKYVRSGWT